jgi:hypothetical protein
MKWMLHRENLLETNAELFTKPDLAIDRACALIDDGQACCWISFGTGAAPVEIAKSGPIYTFWSKSKPRCSQSRFNSQQLCSSESIDVQPSTRR